MAGGLMYLVDTNIWLERLLDQKKSDEVGLFLSSIPTSKLIISDFSLHSIGVILGRLRQQAVFMRFVDDVLLKGGVSLQTVPLSAMQQLVKVMNSFNLDFDDAYQYVIAELAQADIVSFDKDFDRTDKRRTTPSEIIR